jgi:pyruvate/2-oxoglutarate dehydrogenase complex dihydrolipoamide acyltransferase (E2) component
MRPSGARVEAPHMSEITVADDLWRSGMAPEGVLVRWRRADGEVVAKGEAVAEIIVEEARHEIMAPAAGRLRALAARGALVEPGSVIGLVEA